VNCTRDSDVVFRYGGEEFVVILTNTEGDGAVYLAERVRVAVAALKLDGMANHGSVTISGGVAEFHQGDTPTDLLCRADKMLYGAKAKGRNRVQGASD
jgi:diguanylate cyclase (GGDEF)-like protein